MQESASGCRRWDGRGKKERAQCEGCNGETTLNDSYWFKLTLLHFQKEKEAGGWAGRKSISVVEELLCSCSEESSDINRSGNDTFHLDVKGNARKLETASPNHNAFIPFTWEVGRLKDFKVTLLSRSCKTFTLISDHFRQPNKASNMNAKKPPYRNCDLLKPGSCFHVIQLQFLRALLQQPLPVDSPSCSCQPVSSFPSFSPVVSSHEPGAPAAFPWLPSTLLQKSPGGNFLCLESTNQSVFRDGTQSVDVYIAHIIRTRRVSFDGASVWVNGCLYAAGLWRDRIDACNYTLSKRNRLH